MKALSAAFHPCHLWLLLPLNAWWEKKDYFVWPHFIWSLQSLYSPAGVGHTQRESRTTGIWWSLYPAGRVTDCVVRLTTEVCVTVYCMGWFQGVVSFPWIFSCNAEFSPCWALPEYIRALIHLVCLRVVSVTPWVILYRLYRVRWQGQSNWF